MKNCGLLKINFALLALLGIVLTFVLMVSQNAYAPSQKEAFSTDMVQGKE
jgi:hypothetical protein